jgi:hypothetical protein
MIIKKNRRKAFRSSVFTKDTVSGLYGWWTTSTSKTDLTSTGIYKTSDTSTPCVDGEDVYHWVDRTANAWNAVKVISSPKYYTSSYSENGLPVVKYTTYNQGLAVASGMSIASVWSLAVVINQIDTSLGRGDLCYFAGPRVVNVNVGSGKYGWYTGGGWQDIGDSPTGLHALIFRLQNTSPDAFLDGTSGGTGIYTETALSSPVGIFSNNGGTTGLNANACELMIFNRIISTGDIATLQTYFKSKWGTP